MLSSLEFHKEFHTFSIPIHEIGVNGLRLRQPISKEALSSLLFEPKNELFSWRALDGASVRFEIERENEHIFIVQLSALCPVGSPCVRCLDLVCQDLAIECRVRMLECEHLGIDPGIGVDLSLDDESQQDILKCDSSVGYFSKKRIDLGIILRDQIFLMVPDYPQCSKKQGASCNNALDLVREEESPDNPFVQFFKKAK